MTSRSVSRLTVLAVALVLLGGTFAQAAVIGTTTLVRQPPGIPFSAVAGTNDSSLGVPWVGYTLGLQSDSDIIAAVDVLINGQLHQRWTPGEDDEGNPVLLQTNTSGNATNADSHLRPVTGALFGSGPAEDNTLLGSPLANTASAAYGVGTTLSGAWGIPAASQGLTANLAYIVIPEGSPVNTVVRVKVAGQDGGIIGDLDVCAFFECGPSNLPPDVGDLGPLVGDMSSNGIFDPTIVSGTLPASDDGGVPPLTWMFDAALTGPGIPAIAPTLDADTGLFSWDVNGSKGGLYTFSIKATDAGPGPFLSDGGLLTVQVIVPEPATFCLIGLALVGFAGFRRKR